LNHGTADLGIPRESGYRRTGITLEFLEPWKHQGTLNSTLNFAVSKYLERPKKGGIEGCRPEFRMSFLVCVAALDEAPGCCLVALSSCWR
jgi:hypothetical protein